MDCNFKFPQGRFNYRVAGIFVHNGRLLAMKEAAITHYYLPGGRVRLHETMEEALCREIREELGVGSKVDRPLWLCESFFAINLPGVSPSETPQVPHRETCVHEIAMYFLAELDWKNLPSLTESFTLTDSDGEAHFYTWLSPEEVRGAAIYPLVLKESFPALPDALTLVSDVRDRICTP